MILDGRAVAAALRAEISAEAAEFTQVFGRSPSLAAVEVAGDPAAARYTRAIRKACDGAGFAFHHAPLPQETTQAALEERIRRLSGSADVDGILLHMPLPKHLDAASALAALDPDKDVDGAHPLNAGRLAHGLPSLVPNTPAGGMELLARYDIPVAGRSAVVVGRSVVVGKPLALLLLQADATVTICHSRTPNLAQEVRRADIVAVAAGRAGLVTGAMIKPGAVVVDFGINVADDGTVRGDVDYASAVDVASAITPVPGGTGPVTNMMLLRNILWAAHNRQRS